MGNKQANPRKNEIVIAIIGLIGIVSTAVFSNWDKIVPDTTVMEVKVVNYKSTGNFETELRYFMEVSGGRALMKNMLHEMLKQSKQSLIIEFPEDAQIIERISDVAAEEAITYEEVINKILPVYQKYFTVEEMQELNKFYSTDIMQNMMKKMPYLIKDIAPIQLQLMKDFNIRYQDRVDEILEEESRI